MSLKACLGPSEIPCNEHGTARGSDDRINLGVAGSKAQGGFGSSHFHRASGENPTCVGGVRVHAPLKHYSPLKRANGNGQQRKMTANAG